MKPNTKCFQMFFSLIFNLLICNLQSGTAQMYWNQACQFAGTSSSYVAVPNSSLIDITGSFTIEAWVNPSSLSGASKGIVSKGGALGTPLTSTSGLTNTSKEVALNSIITDIDVYVSLNHTKSSNLKILIVHQDKDSIVIFDGLSCNSPDNNLALVFDDQADSVQNELGIWSFKVKSSELQVTNI